MSLLFIPSSVEAPPVYRPLVYGAATVRYVDSRLKVDYSTDIIFTAPLTTGPVSVDWTAATPVDCVPSELTTSPADGATFAPLPSNVVRSKSAETWARDFVAWLCESQSLSLLRADEAGLTSTPGESERDFRIRLQHASREARDQRVDHLQKKYAPRVAAAEMRLRRAESAVTRESEQARSQSIQTAISFGKTLLGALVGRKAVSLSTLGRATTAARGVGRTIKESRDIGRAKETVQTAREQLDALNEELQTEIESAELRANALAVQLDTLTCRPKKSNISVKLVALVWAP